MSSTVCVDASFIVKLIIPEENTEQAEAVWQGWLAAGTQIVAPALLPFEVGSAVRKQVQRGRMSEPGGATALVAFQALAEDITLVMAAVLQERAWQLAGRYQQPRLYDSYYVALAESMDCPLWSADDRLRRAMSGHAGRHCSSTATRVLRIEYA